MYKISIIVTANRVSLNSFLKYLINRYPAGMVDSQPMAVNVHLITVMGLSVEDLALSFLHDVTVNNINITEY